MPIPWRVKGPKFEKLDQQSTLPPKFSEDNCAVTLKITDDDQYLFVTNSGDNSVAIYKIDEEKKMDKLCVLPVSGIYPRDIYLFPRMESILLPLIRVGFDYPVRR